MLPRRPVRGRLAEPSRRLPGHRRRHGQAPRGAGRVHRATGRVVRSLDDVPDSRAVLFDVTPRQLLRICGDALPVAIDGGSAPSATAPASSRSTTRSFEPVPWTNPSAAAPAPCTSAAPSPRSRRPRRPSAPAGTTPPFVLVAQPCLFDPTGAGRPAHAVDVLPRAAGSTPRHDGRHRVADRAVRARLPRRRPRSSHGGRGWYEAYDPNLVGGDIAGGSHAGLQLLLRPRRWCGRRTRRPTLGSSSAPHPRLRAAASTACAGTTPRRPPAGRPPALRTEPSVVVFGDGDPRGPRRGQRPAARGHRPAARARRTTSTSSATAATCPTLEALIEAERPTSSSPTSACRRPAPTRASSAAAQLRDDRPEVGVVVLSQYAEPAYALALLDGGSEGRAYLLKERVERRRRAARRHPGGGRAAAR